MRSWEDMDQESRNTFEYGMSKRLEPDETFLDVMSFCFETARLRLSQTGSRRSEPEVFDMELVAAVLCWWPLKPEASGPELDAARSARRLLFDRYKQSGEVTPIFSASYHPANRVMETLFSSSTEEVFNYLTERGQGTASAGG